MVATGAAGAAATAPRGGVASATSYNAPPSDAELAPDVGLGLTSSTEVGVLCAAAAASRFALLPWNARSAADDGGRGGRQEAPRPGVMAPRAPGVAYSLRPVQLAPSLGGDPVEPGEPVDAGAGGPRAGESCPPPSPFPAGQAQAPGTPGGLGRAGLSPGDGRSKTPRWSSSLKLCTS